MAKQEEVLDDEDILDDEEYFDDEEYIDDGDIEPSDEAENDGEDDTEEGGDEDEFDITVDGVTQRYTSTQLGEMLTNAKQLKKDYTQAVEIVEKYSEYLKGINEDELIQKIFKYRQVGYTEKQIEDGLAKAYLEREKAETKTFDSVEEERAYEINKAVEERFAVYKKQFDALSVKQQEEQMITYNNGLISSTIAELGLSVDLLNSKEFVKELEAANAKYNDGENLAKHKLKKGAATALVEYAASRMAQKMQADKPKERKVKAGNRAEALPNVVPGTSGNRVSKVNKDKSNEEEIPRELSRTEMSRRWSEV